MEEKSTVNKTEDKNDPSGNNSSKKNEKQNSDANSKKSKKKKTAVSYAIEFFIKIGITALVVALLLVFVAGVYVNHNNSSYPMIKDGDLCLTYKLAKLKLGDEIAYKKDGKIKFGRIVAMPGDVIDMSDNHIIINGYGAYDDAVYETTAEGASISFPYSVPNDTYFVLNDYRDDITDSRTYGGISKTETNGKVILVLRMRGI
ncbi:signal peptidase I [Lachnospiraceae bacterium NE2001]|nr:signal peptidase I [Lachnospiraceae bacterium NE2001]